MLAKKIAPTELLQFVYPLCESLLDAEGASASGACVVLNGMFRTRGPELVDEVPQLIKVCPLLSWKP